MIDKFRFRKSAIDESYRYRLVWTILNDFLPYISLFILITVLIAEKYGGVTNSLPYILLMGSLLNSLIVATGHKYIRLFASIIVTVGFMTIWVVAESNVKPVLGITILISALYSLFDAIISELSDAPRPIQRAVGYLAENLNRFAWMLICLLFISDSFVNIAFPNIVFLNLEFGASTIDYYIILNLSLFITVLVLSMLMLVWRNEQLRSVSHKLKLISSWNIHEDTLEKDLLRKDQSELKHVNRTIIFGDVRGFTSYSENNPIVDVVNVLHELYHIVEEVLVNYSSAKPEFIADEFIIFFDDTSKAVEFAAEVIFKLEEMLITHDLSVGIGLDNGDVIEGIVGSVNSKKYTGFGRAVNTASRLQGIADGGEILVSQEIVKEVPEAIFEFKDEIELKGIEKPYPVYSLLGFKRKDISMVDMLKSRIGVS